MSSTPAVYVFDTNVFIHAYDGYYAPQFTDFFWSEIARLTTSGRIIILDKVRNELKKQDDWLCTWVDQLTPILRVEQEAWVVEAYGQVQAHIVDPRFAYNNDSMIDWLEDGTAADPWIIATALGRGSIVVTDEKRVAQNQPKRDGTWMVKIPDVCDRLGVATSSLFEAMVDLGLKADSGL